MTDELRHLSDDLTAGDADAAGFERALLDEVERFVARRRILIASDFDGTLSEIVERPRDARPVAGAVDIIERLATLDEVTVLLISGRGLDELASLSGGPAGAHLVGGHGAQFSTSLRLDSPADRIDPDLYERVNGDLQAIAAQDPGLEVEQKATGVALHYRRADATRGEEAAKQARDRLEALEGVHVKTGKAVVEFSLVQASKGKALRRVREALRADATLFVGDDVTDEEGFEALGPEDVTIKVGDGVTRARHRIADPGDVVSLLALVYERRKRATSA
jgi:trehalose 6-phosphate phosphatase